MILVLICLITLSSCSEKEASTITQFDDKTLVGLKDNAKTYTEEEFQNSEVPLNEFIQISGEIIQSEKTDSEVIDKGTRFVLKSGDSKYQVFNEQMTPLLVGDKVTVYGEYYGIIKGTIIEKEK